MLLSDLIVIQRAWALFKDQRRVILLPFILWIGVVGEWTVFFKLEVVPLY